jgi:hypothetical protein
MEVNRYIPPIPFITWDAEAGDHTIDANKCVTLMFNAYLECAEWADKPEDEDWDSYGFYSESMDLAWFECCAFLHLAEWNTQDWTMEQLGRDFWLTRNGHGAGFWDRDIGTEDSRSKLTELSKVFGMRSIYTNGGYIYIS